MHQLETSIVNFFCFVIDTVSALIIVGYCVAAFITAVRSGRSTAAHGMVARGALTGMSVKIVGAFLKTIQLQTWNQIGLFVAILSLRIILKKVFQRENKLAARPGQISSQY